MLFSPSVTSTKRYKLSFAGIVMFLNTVPDIPSKLILNGEFFPSSRMTLLIFTGLFSLLYISSRFVVEPTVVKIVSKSTVSFEKESASLENKTAFLQLVKLRANKANTIKGINKRDFFKIYWFCTAKLTNYSYFYFIFAWQENNYKNFYAQTCVNQK